MTHGQTGIKFVINPFDSW